MQFVPLIFVGILINICNGGTTHIQHSIQKLDTIREPLPLLRERRRTIKHQHHATTTFVPLTLFSKESKFRDPDSTHKSVLLLNITSGEKLSNSQQMDPNKSKQTEVGSDAILQLVTQQVAKNVPRMDLTNSNEAKLGLAEIIQFITRAGVHVPPDMNPTLSRQANLDETLQLLKTDNDPSNSWPRKNSVNEILNLIKQANGNLSPRPIRFRPDQVPSASNINIFQCGKNEPKFQDDGAFGFLNRATRQKDFDIKQSLLERLNEKIEENEVFEAQDVEKQLQDLIRMSKSTKSKQQQQQPSSDDNVLREIYDLLSAQPLSDSMGTTNSEQKSTSDVPQSGHEGSTRNSFPCPLPVKHFDLKKFAHRWYASYTTKYLHVPGTDCIELKSNIWKNGTVIGTTTFRKTGSTHKYVIRSNATILWTPNFGSYSIIKEGESTVSEPVHIFDTDYKSYALSYQCKGTDIEYPVVTVNTAEKTISKDMVHMLENIIQDYGFHGPLYPAPRCDD